MKTNFKRIGKQSISIVLAVMMMLSTMLVGMVTSNAANETGYPYKQDYMYVDLSAVSKTMLGENSGVNYYWDDGFTNYGGWITKKEDLGNNTYKFDFSAIGSHEYFRGFKIVWDDSAGTNIAVPENNTYNCVKVNSDYTLSWTTYSSTEPTTKYSVTYTDPTGSEGVVSASIDPTDYKLLAKGTTVNVTVTVKDGYTASLDVDDVDVKTSTNGNTYTFTFSMPAKNITVAPKVAKKTANVVYLKNSANWASVNIYVWYTNTENKINGVWPGEAMKSLGDGVYSYELDSTIDPKTVSLIFSNNGGSQTSNFAFSEYVGKIYDNKTGDKSDYATKYNVIVDSNIKNGTVTPSKTSLAAGDTFTVTAEPNDGYELDAITVKDASDNPINPNSDGSYTMPESDVTVSATFAPKPDCRLGFGYATGSSDTMGTFSCSSNGSPIDEGTYPYGTEVTFNAVAKEGYVFKGWYSDINGTSDCLSTETTYTFKLTKETDVFAKFAEATGTVIPNLYLIYSDSTSDPSKFTQYLNLYRDADGQVYAYFDRADFDTSKTYCFTISDSVGKSTSWEYAYDNYNNSEAFANESNRKYLDCGKSSYNLPKQGQDQYKSTTFARFRVLDDYADTISSVKINLGYYNGADIVKSSTDSTKATTYEIIPDATSTVSSRVKVYAKDGTIRATYQKYANMADTKISYTGDDVTKLKSATYYEEGYAKLGSTITVTTTIAEPYRSKYYVKAFSVNGYSYGIIDSSKANADGVYSFECTIPEDCTDKFIEITPIYYYIDDTDTVTFYVEGFDETVQAKWGNTVAVQAWYTNGEEKDEFNSLTKNALGGYPGQPLVYQGGKYSMQIPKYLNGKKANYVKGITLNNYFWDDIHKQNFDDTSNTSESNCQTYDYDDFYKLSETADVDNIIFDFRYRTTTDNDPKNNLASSTYNKNELEPLKDYYGNIVDIFGNFLSEDWKDAYNSNYLTVISNGYKKIENIGNYATEWSVYDKYGTYITTINCSSLIDEKMVDTSSYKEAYDKLKKYAGSPVMIAYEMSIFDGYDKGTRADGRWYFSKKAQKISANVKIEYRADDTSPFVEDAFVADSNVGVNTKAQAYFTNADSNGKTTCQGIVDGGNFSVHAQTDSDAKYYFIGWYLKTSDGYSFITNESDADFPMTNNATYVARFIPTPSGTLTLSHTLLTGSADGKTFIKADIIDSNNIVKASIAETSGNLVIPSKYVTYTSTYKIRLTLRTVPYGNDTVEGFYEGYSSDTPKRYDATFTGTGEKTYSVVRAISSLFEPYEDDDHNTSYRLIKSNIPFYSNIKSNPINYQITYVYFTRLDDQQIYVIKDTVSGIELEEMWAANEAAGLNKEQLSKAFITKKAPFVSNYREEITWDMDHAIIDHDYTATVLSNTKTVNPKISALTVAGSWTLPTEVEYGTLAKSNGDYLYKTGTDEFPAKFNYSGATDYEFSFWAIFDNLDAAQNYSNAVATYMSGTPDADMSKRLTALTTLNGYDKLIAKSYSKEYNYISYQDYYIVPVYANRFAQNEIKESQASIRLLEYTRNQWTNENGVMGDGTLNEGGSKTDYLYTDFALSFDKNQELIKNNANIKVGIAFEVVAKYADVENLEKYETDSNTAAIGDLLKNATSNGKVGSYKVDNDSADRNVYRYEINNSDISVKNRIEYYLRFKNSKTSQQNVMKVYSYIYDTKSGDIYLSDPVYMNMYDIGNLTYITSDLANINLQPAGEL